MKDFISPSERIIDNDLSIHSNYSFKKDLLAFITGIAVFTGYLYVLSEIAMGLK